MKKYDELQMEIVTLCVNDIITNSPNKDDNVGEYPDESGVWGE